MVNAGAGKDERDIRLIIADVARIAGTTRERIVGLIDADLTGQCGLDSLQMLQLWATLEHRFGLPDGILGVMQPLTVASIAVAVTQLHNRAGETEDY